MPRRTELSHKWLDPRFSVAVVAVLASTAWPHGTEAQTAATFITPTPSQRARTLEPTVLRERRVTLDGSLLGALGGEPAERLRLDLFPDVTYIAVRDEFERQGSSVTWSGRLAGRPFSTAVFAAVGEDALSGYVTSPMGEFALKRRDGVYVIQQLDPGARRLPNDAVRPPELPVETAEAPAAEARPPLVDATASVIDALVVYTSAAARASGGSAQILADIRVMVELADKAYKDAGIGGLRLAGTTRVDYAGEYPLWHLRQPRDGHLDDVHRIRDRVGADVVSMIAVTDDYCGIAYLTVGEPDASARPFSVVAQDCVVGLTFAHEVGHNLSLHHDWYVTTDPGVRPFSKGYVNRSGRFLTIMAYYEHCVDAGLPCARIAQFSNPRASHAGVRIGVPSGTNRRCTEGNLNNPECDADAASTIIGTAPVVAAFRPSTRLDGGQVLRPGDAIVRHSSCRLGYQGDGNLVASTAGGAYWASRTHGTRPGLVAMQRDGDFVVYDANGTPRWSSGTAGNPGAYVGIQHDCNVVVRSADGTPLWATGRP